MKNNILWIILICLIIIPLTSAENVGTYRQNNCVNLVQTCSNCSYVNITSISYPNSTIILSNKNMAQVGSYFSYNFCNTSLNGVYIVTGIGNPDGVSTIWNYDFTITPNGEELSIGKAIVYVSLIFILIFFLILVVVSFINFDNLLNKVGMIGLGYLMIIAITFIGWNMASDFLTSAPFLVEMLRILFFVFMAGLFPLLIGAFAWYVLMLFKIKEIEDLMKHGMSEYDASDRVRRKR